jgi:hypothetical protein
MNRWRWSQTLTEEAKEEASAKKQQQQKWKKRYALSKKEKDIRVVYIRNNNGQRGGRWRERRGVGEHTNEII